MTTLTAIDVGYRGVKALATNGRAAHFPSEIGTERKATFSLEETKRDSLAGVPDEPGRPVIPEVARERVLRPQLERVMANWGITEADLSGVLQ